MSAGLHIYINIEVISSPDYPCYAADSDVVDFVEEKSSLFILFEDLDSEITTDEINKAVHQLKLNKTADLHTVCSKQNLV